MSHASEEVDPRVVELVIAIRDRFGLRGLRGAQRLIAEQVAVAERAVADLTIDLSEDRASDRGQ